MVNSDSERMDHPSQYEHDGFLVYCFSLGDRYEACRPYFEAWHSPDGGTSEIPADEIKDGIRLYLNFGQKSKVVFVRREKSERPEYACWRSNSSTKGRWRTLRFCEGCPDPEVCGYLDQACRLSKSGKPQNAFKPKPAPEYGSDVAPFGGLLQAADSGQTWLNSIDMAYGVLHDLHARVWQIEWTRLTGEIYPAESAFRQHLEERWTTAIFEGRNPLYAVMPWNTDPNQLPTYIRRKYYVEDQGGDIEDAPPLDKAILAVIQVTAAAVSARIEIMPCLADQHIRLKPLCCMAFQKNQRSENT